MKKKFADRVLGATRASSARPNRDAAKTKREAQRYRTKSPLVVIASGFASVKEATPARAIQQQGVTRFSGCDGAQLSGGLFEQVRLLADHT